MSEFLTILAIAGAAAAASPLGGAISLWRPPTTFVMSLTLGFAAGILLGTVSFDMMPKALELSTFGAAAAGFVPGFIAVYLFDLFVNRGQTAGAKSEQQEKVRRFHRRHKPRGDRVTLLAGTTSTEELIEGVSIGVSSTIDPALGIMVALAIGVDNIAESLSIGELEREKSKDERASARRIMAWTTLIGISLLGSALLGWFLLRGLSESVLGFLTAVGAGAMTYLAAMQLLPEAEDRQYQQSAGLAFGAGFLTALVLGYFL